MCESDTACTVMLRDCADAGHATWCPSADARIGGRHREVVRVRGAPEGHRQRAGVREGRGRSRTRTSPSSTSGPPGCSGRPFPGCTRGRAKSSSAWRRGSEAMCGAVGLFSPRRCPPDGQRLPRGNTAENFPMKPKPSVATTRPTPSFTPKRLPRRCPSSTSIVTYLSRSNSVRITVVVPSTTLQVTSECLELPRPIPTSISTLPTNRRNRNMVSMCRGSSRSPLLIKYTRAPKRPPVC